MAAVAAPVPSLPGTAVKAARPPDPIPSLPGTAVKAARPPDVSSRLQWLVVLIIVFAIASLFIPPANVIASGGGGTAQPYACVNNQCVTPPPPGYNGRTFTTKAACLDNCGTTTYYACETQQAAGQGWPVPYVQYNTGTCTSGTAVAPYTDPNTCQTDCSVKQVFSCSPTQGCVEGAFQRYSGQPSYINSPPNDLAGVQQCASNCVAMHYCTSSGTCVDMGFFDNPNPASGVTPLDRAGNPVPAGTTILPGACGSAQDQCSSSNNPCANGNTAECCEANGKGSPCTINGVATCCDSTDDNGNSLHCYNGACVAFTPTCAPPETFGDVCCSAHGLGPACMTNPAGCCPANSTCCETGGTFVCVSPPGANQRFDPTTCTNVSTCPVCTTPGPDGSCQPRDCGQVCMQCSSATGQCALVSYPGQGACAAGCDPWIQDTPSVPTPGGQNTILCHSTYCQWTGNGPRGEQYWDGANIAFCPRNGDSTQPLTPTFIPQCGLHSSQWQANWCGCFNCSPCSAADAPSACASMSNCPSDANPASCIPPT